MKNIEVLSILLLIILKYAFKTLMIVERGANRYVIHTLFVHPANVLYIGSKCD